MSGSLQNVASHGSWRRARFNEPFSPEAEPEHRDWQRQHDPGQAGSPAHSLPHSMMGSQGRALLRRIPARGDPVGDRLALGERAADHPRLIADHEPQQPQRDEYASHQFRGSVPSRIRVPVIPAARAPTWCTFG